MQEKQLKAQTTAKKVETKRMPDFPDDTLQNLQDLAKFWKTREPQPLSGLTTSSGSALGIAYTLNASALPSSSYNASQILSNLQTKG